MNSYIKKNYVVFVYGFLMSEHSCANLADIFCAVDAVIMSLQFK